MQEETWHGWMFPLVMLVPLVMVLRLSLSPILKFINWMFMCGLLRNCLNKLSFSFLKRVPRNAHHDNLLYFAFEKIQKKKKMWHYLKLLDFIS